MVTPPHTQVITKHLAKNKNKNRYYFNVDSLNKPAAFNNMIKVIRQN